MKSFQKTNQSVRAAQYPCYHADLEEVSSDGAYLRVGGKTSAVRAGDWIVEAGNSVFVLSDEVFSELFESEVHDTYITRMLAEEEGLRQSIEKLRAFTATSIFGGLSDDERLDLTRQLRYMDDYHEVLVKRIARATDF